MRHNFAPKDVYIEHQPLPPIPVVFVPHFLVSSLKTTLQALVRAKVLEISSFKSFNLHISTDLFDCPGVMLPRQNILDNLEGLSKGTRTDQICLYFKLHVHGQSFLDKYP